MKKVDMSSEAVTARLKRISQLRRLCLALQKTKLSPEQNKSNTSESRAEPTSVKSADKTK